MDLVTELATPAAEEDLAVEPSVVGGCVNAPTVPVTTATSLAANWCPRDCARREVGAGVRAPELPEFPDGGCEIVAQGLRISPFVVAEYGDRSLAVGGHDEHRSEALKGTFVDQLVVRQDEIPAP